MASSTVENYLKQLYLAEQKHKGKWVPMGVLAEAMEVSPGTTTSMVKTLADGGLVEYQSRSGCRLSEGGSQLALHVLRRHRLIELFLVKVLDYDWSEVHEEAEQLEHAISDLLLERIDKFLGSPTVDPHGDPIPSVDGEMISRKLIDLTDCEVGDKVTISRVMNQKKDFLQYLDKQGLLPGTEIEITSYDSISDAMTLKNERSEDVILGLQVARKMMVEKS